MEDHHLLLTYLLLAASHYQGPLAFAFIDFEEAYDQLPRFTLQHVLSEQLKVLEDIRTGIEAFYF